MAGDEVPTKPLPFSMINKKSLRLRVAPGESRGAKQAQMRARAAFLYSSVFVVDVQIQGRENAAVFNLEGRRSDIVVLSSGSEGRRRETAVLLSIWGSGG